MSTFSDGTPYDADLVNDDDGQTLAMRQGFTAELGKAVAFDDDAKSIVATFTKHLDAAAQAATGAAARGRIHAADDLTPQEGRDRLAREALDKGRSDSTKALEQADMALEVLTKRLTVRAMPKASSERAEDHAREELRLLMRDTQDPLEVLVELAGGDDEALAAVACGSLGRSLLVAAGQGADHAVVIDAAMGAAERSSNGERVQAAKALRAAKISGARARGVVATGVHGRLSSR